jgi:trk system potassium uptake protein TrkA
MRVVILGSGRTGALTARLLSDAGHDVTVIDRLDAAFRRLGTGFRGRTVRGNAIEQDTLRRADIEHADVFLAATDGDNRNIMTSQVAKTIFGVKRVVTRIKDPVRAKIYSDLDIEVDCRTVSGAAVIMAMLGLNADGSS